jgi:multiple sugar transport system permease protein
MREMTGEQFILMDNKAGAVAGIVFADAWMWSPFVMLLVLAGLVAVPKYSTRPRRSIVFPAGGNSAPSPSLHPRAADAGAAVPHDRGFKIADCHSADQGRQLPHDDLITEIANEQNKTSEGATLSYVILFMVIVLTNLYLYIANRRNQGG